MALVSDLSPSLAESVDTAQRKVQGARPSLNPVNGVAAARHALLSAFLVQPAHAGQLLRIFRLMYCPCLHVLGLDNANGLLHFFERSSGCFSSDSFRLLYGLYMQVACSTAHRQLTSFRMLLEQRSRPV